MGNAKKQILSERDRALRGRLRLAGAAILVAGLLASVIVDATAPAGDLGANADSRRYEYEMELIGGKSNLLAAEIREWFGALWHGKGLAHMLAFVSTGGSVACFLLARRLGHRAPPGRPGGGNA